MNCEVFWGYESVDDMAQWKKKKKKKKLIDTTVFLLPWISVR